MAIVSDQRPVLPRRFRQRSVLPGFGLTIGYSIIYLSLIVLIPLSTIFWKSKDLGFVQLRDLLLDPRVVAAFKLTFGASLAAACVNAVFGLLVAWVLVRYRFFGKRLVDGLVDLPFALPTAVAGISLVTLYAPTAPLGKWLEHHHVHVAFTPLGVIVALIFIGIPFVVRTVQPVLEDIDADVEEAAASLGATRWQTFTKVLAPTITPALMTGFALAFARAIGEYGSVIFIAGNSPGKTEIVPLLIATRLEEYDYAGATAIAMAMLVSSFILLLFINMLQWWTRKRQGHA
jgi:sulfate transport system permease protein